MALYADCTTVNLWNWAPDRIPTHWNPKGVNVVYADLHAAQTGIDRTDHPGFETLLDGY
jgi:prepilin-type processing-associated H-X9-DG protein